MELNLSELKSDLNALDICYAEWQYAKHNGGAYTLNEVESLGDEFYALRSKIEKEYGLGLRELRQALFAQKDRDFLAQFVHCS